MTTDLDDKFYQRADAHIRLSNDQLKEVLRGKASASMMYVAARFNAWANACGFEDGQDMKDASDKTVEYFLTEYRKMLEKNLEDYIGNFEDSMKSHSSDA